MAMWLHTYKEQKTKCLFGKEWRIIATQHIATSTYLPRFTSDGQGNSHGFQIAFESSDESKFSSNFYFGAGFRYHYFQGSCPQAPRDDAHPSDPFDRITAGFTAPKGLLVSPEYPEKYSDTDSYSATTCIYIISQPDGTYIELKIQSDLNEWGCGESNRDNDYLEFRDGDSETSQLMGQFCGTNIPKSIETSQNHLWMK